ncbi:host attachment protein [Chachezhania antarctica]|uniref:baeRF12 domain-containing protein n=1 Tax=Chachezhania antarctica TaxID=2340860 RepID=UPI000EB1F0BC|nr:host attachment family protein [Chachezhania antarctica]|tara:strand:- start:338 stop:826 length:489 start_codon:yes stop_codon:yes gene_type:complete
MDHPIKAGTWILVTDSEKAMFLRNDGDEMDFNFEVVRKKTQDNPPTHEQGTEKPGRFNDGPQVQRSSVDEADWHELEKERFAADLSNLLYTYAQSHKFDSIVIVAAPGVLGNLRSEIHSEVSSKVVAEVDKNLTNMPIDEIEKHLARQLGTARDEQWVEGAR